LIAPHIKNDSGSDLIAVMLDPVKFITVFEAEAGVFLVLDESILNMECSTRSWEPADLNAVMIRDSLVQNAVHANVRIDLSTWKQ
jgi:hypothetical protein